MEDTKEEETKTEPSEEGTAGDELDKVFKNSEEVKDDPDIDSLAIDDDRVRYLKNIGIPSQIKIDKQRAMQWYKEDGIQVRLETISDMKDEDDKVQAKSYGINIGEGQKCWLYFYDGEYKANRITFSGDSFKVQSFPHILNFPVGTNKRDERKYSLLVGKVTEIKRSGDAEALLDRFKYVVETDKDGNFDRESNTYLKALGTKPKRLSDDIRVDWGGMDVVPLENVKKSDSDAKPVTLSQANETDDMK